MTDLDREVQAALEEDGYEVEAVRPTLGEQGALERRSGGALSYTPELWLALYVLGKIGDELVGDVIRAALSRAKGIVLRRRFEGDGQAQKTKAVGIWLPDGSGGWFFSDSERIDDE